MAVNVQQIIYLNQIKVEKKYPNKIYIEIKSENCRF